MRRLATAVLLSLGLACSPPAWAGTPLAATADSAALAPLIAHGSLDQHKEVEHALDRALKRDRSNLPALVLSGRLAVVEGKYDLGRSFYLRVVKLVPGHREAHREIGLLWVREWGRYREPRVLQRALDELELSLPSPLASLDSADWIALTMYAALQCERGAPERARAVLSPRIAVRPTPWAILALAVAEQGLGRLSDADRTFERGIRALGPIERAGFSDIRPVASNAEREAFGQLSLEDRPAWLRVFWKSHDPTPTTDANEFHLEFDRRVTAAFLFFRPPDQKWWDARGDTYVRFGPPDLVDLVDALRELGGGEMTTVAVPDEIIWHYPRFRMDIRLSETTLGGNYTFPFSTRINAFRPYMNRGVRELPAVRDPITGRIAWDPALAHERLIETFREHRGAELLDRGAFMVPIDFRRRIVAFATAHAAFQSSVLGEARQHIAMGVSPKSLDDAGRERMQSLVRATLADTVAWGAVRDSSATAEDSVHVLTATAVLFDPAWREIARVVSRGPFQRIDTADGPLQVAAVDLSAPPGHYYLATAMEDSASIGARREGANLPDYPPSLCLSDLQLVADDSALVRGPRVTVPLPVQTLGADQPLVLAFEAYNLARDIRGQARARVSATIREMPDPTDFRTGKGNTSRGGGLFGRLRTAGVITTEFSDVVRGSTLARTFAVDVSALAAGEYEIDVVVQDEGTGLETSAKTSFVRKLELAHPK